MEESKKRSTPDLKIVRCTQQKQSGHQQAIKKSEHELLGKLVARLTRSDIGDEKSTSAPAGPLEELGQNVSPPLVPKSGEVRRQIDRQIPRIASACEDDFEVHGVKRKTKPDTSSLLGFKKKRAFQGRSLAISVALAIAAGVVAGTAWPWKPMFNSSVPQPNVAESKNTDLTAMARSAASAQPMPAAASATAGLSDISTQLNAITRELSSLRDEIKALAVRQEHVSGAQEQLATAQARLAVAQEEGAAKQDQALQAISTLISGEQSKHRSPAPAGPRRINGTAAPANLSEPPAPPQQDPARPTPPMPIPDHYIPLNR
jgi:hypothetical protein